MHIISDAFKDNITYLKKYKWCLYNISSKNKRYKSKAHIVMQDLLNQENGGLQDTDIDNFTSGNEDFLDRSAFDPNFENAENILLGKRFYINHSYDIIQKKD